MNTVETNSEHGQNEDADGELGMAWWNALSEHSRRYWCFAAKTATPAQAWQYFKAVTLGGSSGARRCGGINCKGIEK